MRPDQKFMIKIKKNWPVVILITILLVSALIRIAEVWNNNFAFTMDQGRDMVDIRHMVVNLSPRLVGPTTSINGVLLGPFWYYFNLIPFVISGGSPAAIVYWQILWYQLAGLFLYLVFKGKSRVFALIAASLFLFMPIGFNTTRYFWNANAMPFFTAIYLAFLFYTLNQKTNFNLLILGLLAGLSFQIEAAFGVLFFPFAFLVLLINKTKVKQLASLIFGFGVTLIPQILFEIRHQFLMTKIFLSEFSGNSGILGEKVGFADRLPDRYHSLVGLLRDSNYLPENIVFSLYLIAAVFFLIRWLKNRKFDYIDQVSLISISFLVFCFIFYLIFPQKLKSWYVLGLSVPLVLFLSTFFSRVACARNKLGPIAVSLISLLVVLYTFKGHYNYLKDVTFQPSQDPSNLRNQLQNIDFVYQRAGGGAFKAYNYLPSVYDYPYQYLFWWYGTNKYGYQPDTVAYLDNQPEYIKDNSVFWTKRKTANVDSPTFLLIETDKEMPSREQAWLGNFSRLCVKDSVTLKWNFEIKELINCQIKK